MQGGGRKLITGPFLLRLLGFFVLVLVLVRVLGFLPWVGPLIRGSGIFGMWAIAIGLSWFLAKWSERAWRIRRDSSKIRMLSAVASPHNQGKLGALLLAQGRAKKALEPLREAARGEPETAEWHYRLGLALLALRRYEDACASLSRCVALEEEHAYGAALLRLAEAETLCGRAAEALEILGRFERNHGPRPESAFRRAQALKKLGRNAEARAAFAEVENLAASAARYQRREAAMWSLRAKLARIV